MGTKLTDPGTFRSLAAPDSGNRITYDADVKGFGVRTTAAGAKSFILNYRANGRERRITIGSIPDWGVSAAREQAKALKRHIDLGMDPMAERGAARDALTVKGLADRYIADTRAGSGRFRRRGSLPVAADHHPPTRALACRGRAPCRHRSPAPRGDENHPDSRRAPWLSQARCSAWRSAGKFGPITHAGALREPRE